MRVHCFLAGAVVVGARDVGVLVAPTSPTCTLGFRFADASGPVVALTLATLDSRVPSFVIVRATLIASVAARIAIASWSCLVHLKRLSDCVAFVFVVNKVTTNECLSEFGEDTVKDSVACLSRVGSGQLASLPSPKH